MNVIKATDTIAVQTNCRINTLEQDLTAHKKNYALHVVSAADARKRSSAELKAHVRVVARHQERITVQGRIIQQLDDSMVDIVQKYEYLRTANELRRTEQVRLENEIIKLRRRFFYTVLAFLGLCITDLTVLTIFLF